MVFQNWIMAMSLVFAQALNIICLKAFFFKLDFLLFKIGFSKMDFPKLDFLLFKKMDLPKMDQAKKNDTQRRKHRELSDIQNLDCFCACAKIGFFRHFQNLDSSDLEFVVKNMFFACAEKLDL